MMEHVTETPYRTSREGRLLLVILILGVISICGFSTRASAADQVGWITLDGPIMEKPNPFGWLVGESSDATVLGLMSMFDDAATRDDITGLAIHIKDLQANTAQTFAICNAIRKVRAANKKVIVYSELYGPAELLVASAADTALIQEGGFVSFPGLYSEEMYLADTLKLLGLQADYVQVGDYKGASEQMSRNGPSKEWSQNIDALLDDMWEQMHDTIQDGRNFSRSQMRRALDQAWAADAEVAVELGLIDAEIDLLDLKTYVTNAFDGASLTTSLGDSGSESAIDMNNPFAMLSLLTAEPDHTPTRETIAIVHIDGPIVDGESSAGGLMGGETVGSRTIRKALSTIEDEDLIRGLVIRINSPGGSAIASEMIWQGVRRVAEKKPVYISVGSMAASGGYYIAVSGDKIYVDPMSIVGSIGVVGGKIVWGGLYDKFEVGIHTRSRGPHASMFGSLKNWSSKDRELIRTMMSDTYDLFVDRVKKGRGRKVNITKIAAGRLFTGRQALDNGMADGLLEFDEVIAQLATDSGITGNEYDVMTYPGPMSFEDAMQSMIPFASIIAPEWRSGNTTNPVMDHLVQEAGASVLKQLVGTKRWPQLRDALNGMMQLQNEPVILMSPRAILID